MFLLRVTNLNVLVLRVLILRAGHHAAVSIVIPVKDWASDFVVTVEVSVTF